MKVVLSFLLVFFKLTESFSPVYQNIWVVWNIGQGQWVTHISPDECLHFDVGGEPGTFKNVRTTLIKFCGQKKNKIYLSHWDMDHYLHIPLLARILSNICWQFRPSFGITKNSAQKIMNLKIPDCAQNQENIHWTPNVVRTTNESSSVFLKDVVLMPGDSPIQKEVFWATNRPELEKVKVLILGHHGSRSSTGNALLANLPSLKWAVASARWVRYRHPHKDTLKRIFERNVPVLRTEDWGHIWFTD